MSGTLEGGRKAAQKNKANNPNFYREIALKAQQKWIENGRKPRGFAVSMRYPEDDPRHPASAGRIGGVISKRGKSK